MTIKFKILTFWSVLILINLLETVSDIVTHAPFPVTAFGVLATLLNLWILWDAYRAYKAEKADAKVVQQVFISINNAEVDAKETARKAAQELAHHLSNN